MVRAENIPTTSGQMVPLLDPNTAGVSRLNDGVMGGISNSNWQDGIFSGSVRLDNNGGFASLRLRFPNPLNVSQFDGFYIKARNMLGKVMTSQKHFIVVSRKARVDWLKSLILIAIYVCQNFGSD